ncbi:enhancer of mRNA-decapping protein 4 [Sipha flava]|uniref:Enhancer of mRNA-decapping protein 4 n=1 Tax=Sipha flava TaxID=143950 RepID=A0A2S2PZG6_9HEMI|nr:enhancer of mRNA-decapping protein 4 [Sipha flava]
MKMEINPDREVLRFDGNDEDCTHLLKENMTTIFASSGSHKKGSSKLTLKNFVDFNWEHSYYHGQLIALHISEDYIAYGFSKPSTSEGLVRVVKRETNERVLIKGFSNIITDIKFAHLYGIIMLACIDQSGVVYVYIVKEEKYSTKQLSVIPIFQINEDPTEFFNEGFLISWCQYIPEQVNYLKELEFEPSYNGKMLAVVRGLDVEIWHIGIASNFTAGPVYAKPELNKLMDSNMLNNIKHSVIKIRMDESIIINVAFSPDASKISIALSNGSFYFYQISFINSKEPLKRIFIWKPEELFLNLRSMVFLDNHKNVVGDIELWKYIVTYSNNNEIILWSCETWKRLQKLEFIRPYISDNPMKLTVDETGRYIFLSDIDHNLLYVMEVSVDPESPKKYIKIVSVTEILLPSPMLNMIIVNTKIDHNKTHFTENCNSGDFNGLNKCTSIINLFAIQPKSIQEGLLCVSSPDMSILEQLIERRLIEPINNLYPKPLTVDVLMGSLDIPQNDPNEFQPHDGKNHILTDLSPMAVHNMVKEKLRLKGITMNSNMVLNNTNPIQNTYNMNEIRECSPSNNEVQTIFERPEEYTFQHAGAHDENFETSSNYSNDNEKEEIDCYSGDSVFNGSSISTITKPPNRSKTIVDIGFVEQINNIRLCLQDINSQLKCLSKKQDQIENKISSSLFTNKTDICRNLEPFLIDLVRNANDQSQRKLQLVLDHHFNLSHKKTSDMVKTSNSNMIDTELFTRSLVASLSPTLDTILKDLFMSTVIPKFEHACCSMFKQIDASFTERSLEYQNELKLLLNEEGNINYKLEFAFERFKTDMSNIIKHTEKKILSSQNEIKNQFSGLLQESSISNNIEANVDTEPTNQYLLLSELIERRDFVTAFEKALNASNLDLVIFVCEKVLPEELFQTPLLKTPVILSLIQQLSSDLKNNTELKQKYLDAAVSNLDYINEHYKEKVHLILIKLDQSIENFIQRYPTNNFCRKLKMLQLAVKTIISISH